MIEFASKKLYSKCVGYDFELLQEDLRKILKKWKQN